MKIYVAQIYPEVKCNFPFTHHFQRFLTEQLSENAGGSSYFSQKYGMEFDLIFNMSAKTGIEDVQVFGPTVFKRTKDVEYTVFIPFNLETSKRTNLKKVLRFLFKGICDVLNQLEFNIENILKKQENWCDQIVTNDIMIK